ncbi:MAG: hypothetical protein L0H94_13660 [Nitrospira sp.]|nr:hypothetical protein [Nitrospira sp.]
MKILWLVPAVLLAGCGVHYTIPNFETGEIEKVVSSGRSPESCMENLKEDANKLNVKVRLTDVQHEPSGAIVSLYKAGFTCTGKVLMSGHQERKASLENK